MSNQIKTITDKSNFENILNKFFLHKDAYLKTKSGDIKIQFFGYADETAAFKIPFLKSIIGNCIIFTRSGDNTIQALIKLMENQGDNIFLFKIDKFQIILSARSEERKSLASLSADKESGKNIIFIINIISYSIIQNSLSIDSKKIQKIKDYVLNELSQAFNHIKIFFCNEGKSDIRMGNFFNNKKPIFIPKINDSANESETKNLNKYINTIYSKDIFLQGNREYISEITVPILYRLKLPYGYLQVNNTSMFSSSSLSIVKKFAILTDELLNKENIFPKAEEKLIISNISQNGLGIVFKERKFIRYFKENTYVYFDILFPGEKKASVLAMVRNITIMDNNIIRVGCSIEEMDALSEVNYDEFISSLPVKPAQEQTQEKIPDRKVQEAEDV